MASRLKKIYYPVRDGMVADREGKVTGCTHMRCEVEYRLGGHSYLSGTDWQRGYYIGVAPVTRGGMLETYVGFSGFSKLLIPCKRQSKKLEEKATQMFVEQLKDAVDAYFPGNSVDFTSPGD